MKLIILRDVLKVPMMHRLALPPGEHVHKGTIFDVGQPETPFKALSREDQEIVALLSHAKAVGDANDPKIVKAVQDELAAEARQEANRVALDARGAVANVGAAFHNLTATVAESERKTAAARK